MDPQKDPFESQCLEALKAVNKILLQLSLYEEAHPSVQAILRESGDLIDRTLAASPRGTVVFAKDHDRWLANGRIIGSASQVGGPVSNLIARFKLSSITFKSGLTPPELIALCELAALRPDAEVDFKKFLTERSVEHIRFNEAVYAKVDPSRRTAPGIGGGGLGAGMGPGLGGAGLGAGLGGRPGASGLGPGQGEGSGGTGLGPGLGEGSGGAGLGPGLGEGPGGAGFGAGPGGGPDGAEMGPGLGEGAGGSGPGPGFGEGAGGGLGDGVGAEGLGGGPGGGPDGEGTGPGSGFGGEVSGAAIRSAIKGQTIETSLQILIRKVARDPDEQAKIFDLIMEQLRREIEQKVMEATKILRREKSLVELEQERTQSVLQNVGAGVIVIDGQGRILMMNPAAEEIYGAPLAEAAGTPVASGAGDKRVVALASEIEASLEGPLRKDIQVQGAAATKRTLSASWAIVKNESGRVVGMVLALTELAKHRELEKVEREFVAHITHELRAPLASIQAALEILKSEFKGKLNADQEMIFGASLSNTSRLAALINGILDFSKIESGQMTVYPKQADPVKMAEEALLGLKPWADKKKVRLALAGDSVLPSAWADPQRTIQILTNLLANAIKFTPAGGSVVAALARSKTEPDRWIEFSVSDTGCGIPKAEQDRIFDKFVQIGAGEMHAGGTGLGLSIAKALVDLQGGRLRVESEEGKGAAFFFTLPIYAPPAEAAAAPPPKRPWWKVLFGLK